MNRLVTVFGMLLFLVSVQSEAQVGDLARLEFTYFPQEASDNSFRRLKSGFSYPIKVGKEGGYLLPGFEYENIHFKYKDRTPFEKGEDLDRYQSFTLNLGYTFPMKNDWRFGAMAGVMAASNFEGGHLENDDLLYTGAILFIKDNGEAEAEKPWRLIFGLHYSTTSGIPFPLPVINYYREFRPNWSYTLGVPKSNLKYEFNEKHAVQAFATLDGFFANIQNDRSFDTSDKLAESLSATIILAGIGYEYSFTKHLVYYFYAGHTLMNDIRLRDGDRDDVLQVNDENTFYGRTGLKIKI